MVLKQIQDLLHDHDCVIIPDFGGLIAQYAPAKIHPVKHTFTPPSKKIAFNEKLKHNDGLLISNLSQHLKVTSDQAQQMVAQFVGSLQSDLAKNQRCELKGIGIFRYNAERKIEFEYLEAEDNYQSHSFGLPELIARPVLPAEPSVLRTVRQETQKAMAVKQKGGFTALSKKYATAAGTVLLGGLTVAFVYFVSLQPEYTLGTLNPASLFQSQSDTTPEQTVAISEQKAEEAPAQTIEELPVTPEETSVKAVEADFSATYESSPAVSAGPVTLKKLETRPVTLGGNTEAPKNAIESAPKTAEAKPETTKTEVAKTVKPVQVKAETKTVAKTPEKAEAKTVAKVAEKVAVKADVKSKVATNTINAETGRYFIISGGYSTLANAERSKKELSAKGADSDIILPMKGSQLHRVSVAEFASMDQAAAKLPELRKKYGKSLWILNY
jgi:nucleoid DNA-binding protein